MHIRTPYVLPFLTCSLLVGCQPAEIDARDAFDVHGEAQATEAVVGGAPADSSQIFGTVSLSSSFGGSFCTGTLVAPRVVVTAAHCVEGTSANSIDIVAGVLNADNAGNSARFDVDYVVAHSSYGSGSATDSSGMGNTYDIAIVVTSEDVTAVNVIPVMPASDVDTNLQTGTSVVVTGYGINNLNSGSSGTLYIAETPYDRRSASEFIAGAPGYADSCNGDSGGPVYAIGQSGGLELIGATSRAVWGASVSCGDGGIYSLVPAFTGWMEEQSGGLYSSDGTTVPPPGDGDGDGDGDTGDCNVPWIGDGYCDAVNNNGACQYDGGDCCQESCQNAQYDCGSNGFDCVEPTGDGDGDGTPGDGDGDGDGTPADGSCVDRCGVYDETASCQCDDGCVEYGDCCTDLDAVCNGQPGDGDGDGDATPGDGDGDGDGPPGDGDGDGDGTPGDCVATWSGDGWCDADNNTAACGYDGGDCCAESCEDGEYTCGAGGYTCIDPAVTGEGGDGDGDGTSGDGDGDGDTVGDGDGDTEPEWTCNEVWLGDDKCDCGCGAPDPACGSTATSACDYSHCEEGYEVDANDATTCVPIGAESGDGDGDGDDDDDPETDDQDDQDTTTRQRAADTSEVESGCSQASGGDFAPAMLLGLFVLGLRRRRRR